MKITFLGTSSGAPSRYRNVSALAVQFDQSSSAWLFDCGEATQHQVMRSQLRLSQIDRIFVTHMHGDHVFGLPGLLASRSLQAGSVTPMVLHGPAALGDYLRRTMELTQMRLGFAHETRAVQPGMIYEDDRVQVLAAPVLHRITAFAYAVVEKDRSGHFDVEQALALGIPPGPIYKRLKGGETVRLEDGREIDGKLLTGPPRRGRKLVYGGDTAYCPALVTLARDADVLIHEATYLKEDAALADRASHATSVTAARVAAEAGVGTLILTHFSTRYEGAGGGRMDLLLEEARSIFPNTLLARDLWTYDTTAQNEEPATAVSEPSKA